MKRARDELTNMLLYHIDCGGPLYEVGDRHFLFCGGCDGLRDPYVQRDSLRHVSMGKPDKASVTLERYRTPRRKNNG